MAALRPLPARLVIGKSSTTEFAFLHPTATLNPRAPGRTPGGSSAGSAAAVAAGLVPLAIGTQTGGSVIRPASYCGVVGYKPSFGWLPTSGLKCFSWSLDTVGLFARNVADVAWFAQAITGRALEPVSGRGPARQRQAALRWWACPTPTPGAPVAASARQAVDAAMPRAAGADGVDVRPCDLPPWAASAFDAHAVIQGFEAALHAGLGVRCAPRAACRPCCAIACIEARAITPAAYEAAQHVAAQARA